MQILDIGDIVDNKTVPLNYCARFLVSRFLLNIAGENSRHIRVSVMSLALGGFAQLVKIYPNCATLSVEKNKGVYESRYINLLS